MAEYRSICCVVNMGDASKVMKCSKKYGIQGGTISVGKGTVNSRLLDFLAINEKRKEIVTMVVEKELAGEAIRGISAGMRFEKPHHGIAFSYAVSEFVGRKNQMAATAEPAGEAEEEKGMYQIIYVVVDKGKAEDVMAAARKVGARGGTITNARGAGIHEIQTFFSMEIEPEKETVFIITKREKKDAIVAAIVSDLKIDEPGKGILFVVDVDEVHGIFEPDAAQSGPGTV